MTNSQNQINALSERLQLLLHRQDGFSKEINALRKDIDLLRMANDSPSLSDTISAADTLLAKDFNERVLQDPIIPPQHKITQVGKELPVTKRWPGLKLDTEKFIGENLINKIGIVITVIGVAIGAKYSIEHDLISPLTRIILGYLAGGGLLGFGIRLKQKFENYSAVFGKRRHGHFLFYNLCRL